MSFAVVLFLGHIRRAVYSSACWTEALTTDTICDSLTCARVVENNILISVAIGTSRASIAVFQRACKWRRRFHLSDWRRRRRWWWWQSTACCRSVFANEIFKVIWRAHCLCKETVVLLPLKKPWCLHAMTWQTEDYRYARMIVTSVRCCTLSRQSVVLPV
jgi:hypothetical protein